MSRSRFLRSVAAASFGVLLLGACSSESLGERAASFGFEQALEGNQDVDFDFGGDGNGGFNISTEDGEFSFDFDEENGGITFGGPDGEGAISFDEDGIVFDTDEGSGSIGFDQENGSITFDTDEGSGSIDVDENGSITFDTDEGSGSIDVSESGVSVNTEEGSVDVFGFSSEPPASWPAAIEPPASAAAGSSEYSVLDLGAQGTVTTAVFTHSPNEDYGVTLAERLVDAGWQTTFTSEDAGSFVAQLTYDDTSIQIISDGTGSTVVSITTM